MLDIVNTAVTERHDVYATIHRGLRRAEMDVVTRLGALDTADELAVTVMVADIRRVLVLVRFHLGEQNAPVATALRARGKAPAEVLAVTSVVDAGILEEAELLVDRLETATHDRSAIVRALYGVLSELLAQDFAYMAEHETVVQPLIQDLLGEEDLAEVEARTILSIPPGALLEFVRTTLPAIDPSARLRLLRIMKAAMPAEAFHAILDYSAKPVLPAAQWRWLDQGLRRA